MKRLTDKVIIKCDGRTEYHMTDASGYDLKTIFDKLGQLEDIEEELGIELSVFIKAHKGIYYKNRFNEIRYCEHPNFIFCQAPADMKWHLFVYGGEEIRMRYGKTWALTKEELEK